jgi:hypothetical protein
VGPNQAITVGPNRADILSIDLDATLVTAHSDKDGASRHLQGGFAFAPNLAFLDRGDGTSEALAGDPAPRHATANNAADNIDLLEAALQALPALPEGKQVVVRGDSALATKDFLGYAHQARLPLLSVLRAHRPDPAAIR